MPLLKSLLDGYSSKEGTMCILVHLNKNRTFRLSEGTRQYGKDSPSRSSIRRWHKKFMEQCQCLDAVRSGRPKTSAGNIESVRGAFSRSSVKSIRIAAKELELSLPSTTVRKVLHKRLRFYAYEVQMLQRLQPNDKPKEKEFADNMLQRISEDEELLTASNTNPVFTSFLCHQRIEERDGGSFPFLVLFLR